MPGLIKKKRAVVNIQNEDNECFKWSVLAALHPVLYTKHPYRPSKYEEYKEELDFTGISFPVQIEDIPKFEKLNSLSINVYIVAEKLVNPLFISKEREQDPINLLLIEGEETNHYCCIKDYNGLLNYDKNPKLFCPFSCMDLTSDKMQRRS